MYAKMTKVLHTTLSTEIIQYKSNKTTLYIQARRRYKRYCHRYHALQSDVNYDTMSYKFFQQRKKTKNALR